MATVRDVAQYILDKTGKITTWKLQKLVYYAQAWHLVWDEEPLFEEDIQAWINGPVCPDLYRYHKGNFNIQKNRNAKPEVLKSSEKESVDAVIDYYGSFTGQQLKDLTHSELPWNETRKGLSPDVRGKRVIKNDLMSEYYDSL